eukprot:TRINITY_DN6966_c2_g1_i2.p1 TRINITY_DN6966_c2_g1~~TRINITY_DN6966_c2_g1_i2.p1  ORF type:complete len:694 (+),score=129.34 TRINITY_DN6966_c2_g1_i2:58-2139(+)
MPQYSRVSHFGGRVVLQVDSAQEKELKRRLQPETNTDSERRAQNGKHVVGDLVVRAMASESNVVLSEVSCSVFHEWTSLAAYQPVRQQLQRLLEGDTTDVAVSINDIKNHEIQKIINTNTNIDGCELCINESCPINSLKTFGTWQLISVGGEHITSLKQLSSVFDRFTSTGLPKFRKQLTQEVIVTDRVTTFKLRRVIVSEVDIQLLPTGITTLTATIKKTSDGEPIHLDLMARVDKYKATPTTILGFKVNQRFKSVIVKSDSDTTSVSIDSSQPQRSCKCCESVSKAKRELRKKVAAGLIHNTQSCNTHRQRYPTAESNFVINIFMKKEFIRAAPTTGADVVRLLMESTETILNLLRYSTPKTKVTPKRIEINVQPDKVLILWGDSCLNSPILSRHIGDGHLNSVRKVTFACSNVVAVNSSSGKESEQTYFKTDKVVGDMIEKVTTKIESQISSKLQMSLGGMNTTRQKQLGPIVDHDGAKRTVVREEDVKRVKRVFEAIDTDKNGYLTLHELIKFSASHPNAIPNRVFRVIVGDDERVGFLELLHGHFPRCSLTSLQSAIDKWCPPEVYVPVSTIPQPVVCEITNIFNTFDIERKGFITPQQLGSQLSKSESSPSELSSILGSSRCSDVITAKDFINTLSSYFSPRGELLALNSLTHRLTNNSNNTTASKYQPGNERNIESVDDAEDKIES